MKTLLLFLCALALAGCARLNQNVYGSWLDQVGQPATNVVPLSAARRAELQAEAAQLRAEGEAVRTRLGVERDRVRRVEYLRELQALGDRLHPIERVLRDGGYPPMPI